MDFKVDGGGCDRRYHSYKHSLPAAVGGLNAEEEDFEVVVERESQNTEIWVSTHGGGGAMETETPTDPINNNSPSLFYSSSLDLIPPLPDFPCMSSSSSSSTTPTPSKPVNAFISTSSATSSLSSSSSATSSSASSSAGSSLVVFRSDNDFDDHNNSHLDVSYHQHHHHHHRRHGPEQHQHHQQQQQIKSDGDGVNLQNCWDEGHDFHYEENNRNNVNQLPAATKEEGDHDMMMNIEDVVECMNVMDDFDTMGLSLSQLMDETNEIWDPTPLFQDNNNQTPPQPNNHTHEEQQLLYQHPDQHHNYLHVDMNHHNRTTTTTPTTTTTYHDDNNHPLPTIIDDDDDDQHHPFLFMDDDDDEHQNTPPKRRLINQHNNQVVDGDDLAVVFFEWLKSNKELSISAEDLRSIKIKKSTIECAAKRLGGGKEGMKQLLKLVLQWVQNHHLHNKRLKSSSSSSVAEVDDLLNPSLLPLNQPLVNNCPKPNNTNLMTQQQHPIDLAPPPPPPPPNCYPNSTSWPVPQPPPPYVSDHIPNITPGYSPMVNYMNTPASDPYSSHITNTHYSHPPLIENSNIVSSWPSQPPPSYPPMIPHYNPIDPTPHFSPYTASQYPPPPPYQFFPGITDATNLRQMGTSATKEARKKRMARQRRVFTHNHNRTTTQQHHHQNHHQQQNSQMMIHGGGGAGMMISDGGGIHSSTGGPWGYWPTNSRAGGVVVPTNGQMVNPPIAQIQQQQQQVPPSQEMERPTLRGNGSNSTKQTPGPDKSKLQGSKTEKNLKFLLQKVLKQSDVGNLGRIVLPKKEAETHLPELDARDGIPIAMEDIGTSRVWNMRYRFWPNNKSRMYLLENTGDFVRSNGLQEGDFIVIYSDVKCGKYMIRGVKVRTPQGPKPDSNKKQLQKIETATAGLIC